MISVKHFNPIFLLFAAVLSAFAVLLPSDSAADDDYEIKMCKKKLNSFDKSLSAENIGAIIAEVGKSFLGVEYSAGTLDRNMEEKLVIKITGLDCVTFVENVLAISRVIKSGKMDFENFSNELKKIRYRGGEIDGYTSRLHYFTDWIYDNESKGIVQDITKDIGGKPYNKTIDFMSTHSGSYKQLKNNPENIKLIEEVEQEINTRNLYYIPKGDVDDYYDRLETGDIIATTTGIDGLDVTHTGFIYKSKGKTLFLHASIQKMEIIISKEQLKEYLKSNKKQTGIIVARPL